MCKFNQIVAQIAAALLDRISLPERMDTASHCDMRPLPWQVRSLCPIERRIRGGSHLLRIVKMHI